MSDGPTSLTAQDSAHASTVSGLHHASAQAKSGQGLSGPGLAGPGLAGQGVSGTAFIEKSASGSGKMEDSASFKGLMPGGLSPQRVSSLTAPTSSDTPKRDEHRDERKGEKSKGRGPTLRKPTLQKDERVLKSGDFRRALQKGRRFRSPHLTIIAFLKHYGKVRLGLTVSRKVGNAVVRNRIKRRLRELVRHQRSRLSRAWDLVFIAQPGAGDLSFQSLWAEIRPTLEALAKQDAQDRSKG